MKCMDNETAAHYIGVDPDTMKASRISGILHNRMAPLFVPLGNRKIVYKVEILDAWIDEMEQFRTVDQAKVARDNGETDFIDRSKPRAKAEAVTS